MGERYSSHLDTGALERFASSPFAAFLAGVGVGFAAGVFLAPKSGAELRAQISDSAADARERVKQRTSRVIPVRLRERVRSATEQLRSRAAALREERTRGQSETSSRDIADLLNEVSKDELTAVSEIGEVLADKIILNRPYTSERELLEKDVIRESAFEALRRELLRKAA